MNPFESAPMAHFSTVLDQLLRDRDLNQSELSAASGVDQSQLSRYLRENALPDAEKLEKLCAYFGPDAGQLLVGYIRDRVPTNLLHLVNITPTGEAHILQGDNAAVYSRLPRRTQAILEQVAEACERNPAVIAVLESTLDLLKKR